MPSDGLRMQLAASTRSPSISTMQARNFDALPLGDLPDGLARQRLDVLAVEREFHRRSFAVCIGHNHQLPNGLVSSSGKYLITLSSGFGAAWPSPQMDASRMAVDSSSSSFTSHGPLAISLAAFSVPTRQGVH